MKSTSIKISVDDGCVSDLRLAELCERYKIPLIIYLPIEWHSLALDKGFQPLAFNQAYQLAFKHQLGAHGITHRYLTQIPVDEAKYEIEYSGLMLQNLMSVPISHFAPPRGYLTPELKNYAQELYTSVRMTKADNLVHIHPNSGANGNKSWLDAITDKTKELWCHSWELDKFNLWPELEAFLEGASSEV